MLGAILVISLVVYIVRMVVIDFIEIEWAIKLDRVMEERVTQGAYLAKPEKYQADKSLSKLPSRRLFDFRVWTVKSCIRSNPRALELYTRAAELKEKDRRAKDADQT